MIKTILKLFMVTYVCTTNAYVLKVINNTNEVFDKIDVVLTATNFDSASYGRSVTQMKIWPHQSISVVIPNTERSVPCSGTSKPEYTANLDIMVVVSPTNRAVQAAKDENILPNPTKIKIGKKFALAPPSEITVTITGKLGSNLKFEYVE